MNIRLILSFGSNLGNKEDNINKAIDLIGFKIFKISQFLYNDPILLPNSPKEWKKKFVNCVVEYHIDEFISPYFLLTKIKKIEKLLGRLDRGKWGPREIDIDIIFYSDIILNSEFLNIPHKEVMNREFLLFLLRDINYIT